MLFFGCLALEDVLQVQRSPSEDIRITCPQLGLLHLESEKLLDFPQCFNYFINFQLIIFLGQALVTPGAIILLVSIPCQPLSQGQLRTSQFQQRHLKLSRTSQQLHAIFVCQLTEDMLLNDRNKMAALEVLQRSYYLEVIGRRVCLAEDSIAFDEELVHESEHLHIAERGKLNLQASIGVLMHKPEEIVLEQGLFIGYNDGIPADMCQLQLPIVLRLSLIILHLLLIISQGLYVNDVSLRSALINDGEADEVEIVEILAIVPSETEQGTADDQSGMSSARLRPGSFCLERFQGVGIGLVDQNVTRVLSLAHPSSEDEDLSIVNIAGVPPSFQPLTIAHHFLPVEATTCPLGEELAEVYTVDISLELVIIPAPADHIEMISYQGAAMEPALAWSFLVICELQSAPGIGEQVESPAILQVDV